MRTSPIPKTDLVVPSVCLGTMTFGTPVPEERAVELVHYALDKGINFVDTANMYEGYARHVGSPGGAAEKIIGKALSGRREDFVIATKVGMNVGEADEDEGTSAAAIRKHLDLSLQRLGTDYVDIYYLHKPDPEAQLGETLQALDDLIQRGKVRYYGLSNYSADQLSELLSVADDNGLPRPVVIQPGISLLKQDDCADLLPLCNSQRIGVVPYQVLQGGLLTGKYKRSEPLPADSRKAEKDGWVWDLTDRVFEKLDAIEKQAAEAGLTMTQFAIRWILQQQAVVSAIVGVKRESQIDDAVNAADGV